ncbi:phosphoserine phosphatase SerB [Jannaschia aquimarina]|uniref:Phosphoserine phosphatase n=1 Tax=Jannaschia aquimarina TaxID=935700 RepID=A0A0D1EFL6_9RHOB|nr:phosphoserine phosphatase SerB [Jannaschia aquimarina]KIT15676.1 Phosphoserine phosphatase [Jannaschia aquimarina]SNT39275.1 phosphoserine phosphatase [Jannaschia aquimarina]
MFTTILTCDPARASLDAPTIEALRNAWGGGDARWLARGIAAEFDMPARHDPAEARAGLDAMGVDVNVVPAEGRRKRLLLADMDSTMIRQECIDELAAEAGVGDRVAAITARAMNGEIGFEGALRERVGLLAGLDVSVIDRVLAERITPMPGGAVLVATMRAGGAHAALVSGGFTAFTGAVAADLGFDSHRANTLLVADGRLTGAPGEPILGREAKIARLEELVTELGIAADDAIAVGDGANDLGMLHRAGMGVALHAKPAVQAEADLVVNHGDLTALLYLQGYREDEFVDPSRN